MSQLGEMVGVGRSEVSRVVGGAEVKEATLEKYAHALGVSVVYLRHGAVGNDDARAIWTVAYEMGRQSMVDDAIKVIEALRDTRNAQRELSSEEVLDIAAHGGATLTNVTPEVRQTAEESAERTSAQTRRSGRRKQS